MLGFPQSTELKQLIPKKKVYEHFASDMSAERRKSFDEDIARITVVNEISTASLNIADGTEVHSFFIVAVALKKKDFDKQNITFLARMFGQNLVLVLSCGQEERLALWQTKLLMNEWQPVDSGKLTVQGLNMDALWESIVVQIAGMSIEEGNTLNEQIAIDDKRQKLQKEIERLEKQARSEKQPKRKMEMVQRIKTLKEQQQNV